MSVRAWTLLLVCSALWGLPYLLIKVAVDGGASAGLVAFTRVAIGAAVLLPLALRRGGFGQLRGRWGAVFTLAALDLAVPFLLISLGEQRISSSLAGILIATVPLLIALLAIRFDPSERVRGRRLFGLLVGLAGVGLLLGLEVTADSRAAVGAVLVLLASLTYALATLWLKRAFVGVDPIAVVTGALIAASVMLVPAPFFAPTAFDTEIAAALASLGVFCTAAAYATYYALVPMVGATRASLNTYISPGIAVALGVAVLGEPVTAGAVAGLLMIVLGSWLGSGGAPGDALPVSPPAGRGSSNRVRGAEAARRASATGPDALRSPTG